MKNIMNRIQWLAVAAMILAASASHARDYDIRDYGAAGGGTEDCREAILKAIGKCSAKGGGRVIIPEGKWLSCGPVIMKSDVELHLAEGAELVFSSDPEDYLPAVKTRWEGTECWNWSPLIYAVDQDNISFTGKGTINGSGSGNFATWKPKQKADQKEIRRMGTEQVPVDERIFGEGHWLRPAMLEVIRCNGLRIEDLTFVDSPFWVIHPIECDDVTVRGVTVHSYNLNNDGCDPESCSNVLIEDCTFFTGDDGIAIKSGRDQDGWRMGRPTENVVIRNCTFNSKANGVCIGSEISGGVRNVYIENVRISGAKNGIYFKSNLDRGGFIEDIRVLGVQADTIHNSLIYFDPDYKSESREHYPTRFTDFRISDVTAGNVGNCAIDITGFQDMPIENVRITDVTVRKAGTPVKVSYADNVILQDITINGGKYDMTAPSASKSLNGEWEVALSDTLPSRFISTVPVPGVITQARPSLGEDLDATGLTDDVGYDHVWYRCRFSLDMPEYPQAILKLRAKYNAEVWLNGVRIGYDPYCAYSHGSFDLSDAIRYQGENELTVKVGSWNTATFPSKDNSAEWWRNSRAAGIWDDVMIEFSQEISFGQVSVLPDVEAGKVECRIDLENISGLAGQMNLDVRIMDGQKVMETAGTSVDIAPGNNHISIMLPGEKLEKWSAGKEGNPKLYTVRLTLTDMDGSPVATDEERFGYRQIAVSGRDVLLNGEKVMFRAENIAFTRAVNRWADAVFDEDWIRNFLRTAIHEYNFNYLRIHLGHACSKWYDIADEEGIMLQDEWRFMHVAEPVGKDLEETGTEFRRWILENINHPSIVAWDQENEGGVRLEALKAELRQTDPTRLWSEDDFIQKHIYEYSENIVKDFDDYEIPADKPMTVLESCRFWTNEYGIPEIKENFKTSRTASGWNLYYCDREDAARLLADLHADIGTFYRSRRLQGWAPFTLLSGCVNGHNFFCGDIADSLAPQPNLLVLKRLNEPVGTSFEMLQCREWYKDMKTYAPGTACTKKLWVWNDTAHDKDVSVSVILTSENGKRTPTVSGRLSVGAYGSESMDVTIALPRKAGIYHVTPVLTLEGGKTVEGVVRRLMVTDDAETVREKEAFGGRKEYDPEAMSILENFTLCDIPQEVQERMTAAADGCLIDKIKVKGTGESLTYRMQTTRYESSRKLHVTYTDFDTRGNIIATDRTVAVPFISLPENVKDIIEEVTGGVPEDESRIICRETPEGMRYDISMVGTDIRYRISVSHDGKLTGKEIENK